MRSRLVADIAGSLSQVSLDDVIEKNLAHFHAADPEYGRRVEDAVRFLREDRTHLRRPGLDGEVKPGRARPATAERSG